MRPPTDSVPPDRRRPSRRVLGRATTLAAAAATMLTAGAAQAQAPALVALDWQRIESFEIARTETTMAQFARFVAATGLRTQAEQQGGGQVYESGWVAKPGWTWRTPFGGGSPAVDDLPVVHVTFDEASRYCAWVGARLPTDAEWVSAAYKEQRPSPPPPFKAGRTYTFPTGARPDGAQCLGDCGPAAAARALRPAERLWRGDGPARAGTTPVGVNGLYDMGGNVWEWVDEPRGATGAEERRTRGGSWWYGAAQMRAEHLQSKPSNTAVAYIGFRCARDVPAR